MTDIVKEWGPEIKVDGKRPEWLTEDAVYEWRNPNASTWWTGIAPSRYEEVGFWEHIIAIRLPADHPYYASQAPAIDWSAPIEAVHEDGRVVAVRRYFGPDIDGDYAVTPPPGKGDLFKADGSPWRRNDGWRIRNVATPPADAATSQNGGEVGPEVVERMIALVRAMAGVASGTNPTAALPSGNSPYAEARAIVALLPEPVDGDLVEARRLAADWCCGMEDIIMSGVDDKSGYVTVALAAIKRGRALAFGDKA